MKMYQMKRIAKMYQQKKEAKSKHLRKHFAQMKRQGKNVGRKSVWAKRASIKKIVHDYLNNDNYDILNASRCFHVPYSVAYYYCHKANRQMAKSHI